MGGCGETYYVGVSPLQGTNERTGPGSIGSTDGVVIGHFSYPLDTGVFISFHKCTYTFNENFHIYIYKKPMALMP